MAMLSKFSPILSRSLYRPECLRKSTRPSQLRYQARSFAQTSLLRRNFVKWNVRSVTESKVFSKSPYRLAATWLIPDPTNVAPEQIIRRLPQLDAEHHRDLHNVVFLVTPAFAKWFGADGAFLEAALQHIYGNFAYYHGMHGIQSSVTVINRLPSQVGGSDRLEDDPSNRQVNPIYGHEGIALWIDSTRIDSDVRRSFRDEDFDQRLVRMTFMRPTFREGVTAIELRPANTLFVNGNQSTMFQDSWEVNPFIGRKLTRISSREPLKTLEIFVPSDAPDFSAPIEALTGRREILSSMGNIISQLKSQKDGKPVPASAELEEKVPQYLARRRETGGALVVFALVSPTGLVNSSELDGLVQPSRGNVIEADMSLLRRALLAGAHLHRVTSGGGGWGKKQGLLSLDPDFDFEKHEDTGSLNAMLEGRGSRGRASSTNAVSPGDYVQFFASYEPEQQVLQNLDSPNIKDIDTSDWDGMKWIELAQPHNTIFGSLPSQDDFFMPLQDCKGPASRIIGIPGQFGMLSAGGTCLRRWKFERIHTRPDLGAIESEGDRGKLNQVAISRMDIPYGFWSIQSVNRLQRPPPKIRRVRVPARSEEQHSQSSSPQTSPT